MGGDRELGLSLMLDIARRRMSSMAAASVSLQRNGDE